MELNKLSSCIALPAFGKQRSAFAMLFCVFSMGAILLKVYYSIVKSIFVFMMDNLSGLNFVIREMVIPGEMRAKDMPAFMAGRMHGTLLRRNPNLKIFFTPCSIPCTATSFEIGIVGASASFAKLGASFISCSAWSFIGTRATAIFRRLVMAMNTNSLILTDRAGKFSFHNGHYNMAWGVL